MADKNIVLHREWLSNSQIPATRSTIQKPGFILVSYNILADCHWSSLTESYPYCPKGFRTDLERLPQLLHELKYHDADIICLQEVSHDLYTNKLKPKLLEWGYRGTHFRRGQYYEGVATFFKTCRFEIVDERCLHTHRLIVEALEETGAFPQLIHAVTTHPYYQRAVILSKLKCKHTNQVICLGNVHLSWDIKHQDRVLLEAIMSINALTRFAGGSDKPHILCGDFNLEPWLPGYEFLQNGTVTQTSLNQMKMYTLPEEYANEGTFLVDVLNDKITHNSRALKSAYKSITGTEPPFTCHGHQDCNVESIQSALSHPRDIPPNRDQIINPTPDDAFNMMSSNYENFARKDLGDEIYCGTLDYMWFSSNTLRCLGVLKMIDESEIAQFYSTPNKIFPSDHLLMKAKFGFI